jgi:hypothetical protein
MHNRKHATTPWIVTILLGCGLALIALAGQLVSAQSPTHDLQPPFKFAERMATQALYTREPGSTVLMTETFGISFAPTTVLTGTTPQWRIVTNPTDTAGYYWDRVNKLGVSVPITFSNSVWSATQPITTSPGLMPGVSTYPAGQDTWLIYGPIDLSRFSYGHLSFEYYLDSRAGVPGDTLLWGYSTDGQTFDGNSQSGPLSQWITNTFAFRTNYTSQAVYLAFAFNSQTNPQGLGAFIRNVKLTAEPLKFSYIPSVMKDFIPPTPLPLYGYAFDGGGAADLAEWGGAYYHTGSTKYGQCIPGQCTIHTTTAHGKPADSLRLFTNGLYSLIASSPNDIAPDSYDLYVDMSPWVIYPKGACSPYGCPDNDLGDWYGVIFNATSDTFGNTPADFAYNKKYYRLYFYNIDSVKPITIRLDRCDGASSADQNDCYKLASKSLPSSFIGNASDFDRIHIQRLANGTIKVWLNNSTTPIITVTDATYTGPSHGKYGVFIFSWTLNDTANPPTGYEMQIDFDNIRVYRYEP